MTEALRPRVALWIFAVILLVGAALRLGDIGVKAYGNDEATTSLRVAGYTIADYDKLFDGRTRTVEELLPYQTVKPGSGAEDVVRSLASEDPQHPPLFYLLDRWWISFDRDNVAGHRRLAAVIGIATIPAIAWLVWELCGSTLAALTASALLAVSPFHVLYAQQAREYSLWTLLTALATAALIKLLRTPSPLWAVLYALLLIAGMYTDLLFETVVLAHFGVLCSALAAAGGGRMRLHALVTRSGRPILVAAAMLAAAQAAFLPWAGAVRSGAAAVTNNAFLAQHLPFKVFAGKWLFNSCAVVFDGEYHTRLLVPLAAVTLLFIAYALFLTVKSGIEQQRLATAAVPAGERRSADIGAALTLPVVGFCLMLAPVLSLLVEDVIARSSRSTAARYLTPAWLAEELVLTFAVMTLYRRKPRWGLGALSVLVFCGLISAAAGIHARTWWIDGSTAGLVAQSDAIAALPSPDIAFFANPEVWDFSPAELVDRLDGGVRFTLLRHTDDLLVAQSPGYLLDPSPSAVTRLRGAGIILTPVALGATRAQAFLTSLRKAPADASSDPTSLWRIDRREKIHHRDTSHF